MRGRVGGRVGGRVAFLTVCTHRRFVHLYLEYGRRGHKIDLAEGILFGKKGVGITFYYDLEKSTKFVIFWKEMPLTGYTLVLKFLRCLRMSEGKSF